MIRAIGRLRNDPSPSRTAVAGLPARIPANSRRLVPEFPQSRTVGAVVRASMPGEVTR